MKWLGKILFRNQPSAFRERQMRQLWLILAFVGVLCVICGLAWYVFNK